MFSHSPHLMDCLANLPGSSAIPSFNDHRMNASSIVSSMGNTDCWNWRRNISLKVNSGSLSSLQMSVPAVEQKRSDIYSHDMTQAMGAVLTYRHELGMNFNFIRPDLIVGSCLQNSQDVDILHNIGVKTIFCLQQNSDLEYFGVDIKAIREYARGYGDIEHLRAEIRDFDGYDLRMRLPVVVSKLYDAISRNGGVTYVHCTAGLGRAPAVALAYMFWVQGYSLEEAHRLLQGERPCFPKMDAIKSATADILTGFKRRKAVLAWKGSSGSTVEVSGLDVGWSQRIPLKYDEERALWSLEKELPDGYYEYKYVVDGDWMCNMSEPLTNPNNHGHVNNYVEVVGDKEDENSCLRKKLMGENPNLTMAQRLKIRQFLHTCNNMEEHA